MVTLGIGMPLYNEEKEVGYAIESVLNQTYSDFELHIFDNKSTDNSLTIAKQYAEKDSRIHIHENAYNVGMAANFNKCLSLKDYKYISLKSSNDKLHADYYQKCIDFLKNNEEYVLCYTEGTNTKDFGGLISYDDDDVYSRLRNAILNPNSGNMIYGVYRSDVIDKTLLFDNIMGNDHIFAFNLVMFGKTKKLDEVLYYREQPLNRTDIQYKKSCQSSIKSVIDLDSPFCKRMEMILGYLDVCNNGFLNELDRDRIADTVVDSMFETHRRTLKMEYFSLKKWLDNNKKVCPIDYFELKVFFKRARFYMMKNKRFRKHHPVEYLKSIFDTYFV